MELTDHCNTTVNDKFSTIGIQEFYQHLGENFLAIKYLASRMLSIFMSMYVWGQIFSVIKSSMENSAQDFEIGI